MLSDFASLMSMSPYAVIDFIRDSSEPGLLVAVGSLLFVFGTLLRRHLPAPEQTETSDMSIIWERATPLKRQATPLERVTPSYPTMIQASYSRGFGTPERL